MNIFIVKESWGVNREGFSLLTSGFEDEQDAIAYLKKRYQDMLKKCGFWNEPELKENILTDTYAYFKTNERLFYRFYSGRVVELSVKKSSKR